MFKILIDPVDISEPVLKSDGIHIYFDAMPVANVATKKEPSINGYFFDKGVSRKKRVVTDPHKKLYNVNSVCNNICS